MPRRRRRRIVRYSATAVAMVALAILAYIVVRRWGAGAKTRAQADSNPSRRAVAEPMLRIDNGLLEIGDYDAWFDVLPRAIRLALRRGQTDAEAILVEVFSSILPEQHWPPLTGSPHRWQWQQMVARTAEILRFDPQPTPTRRRSELRVVESFSS